MAKHDPALKAHERDFAELLKTVSRATRALRHRYHFGDWGEDEDCGFLQFLDWCERYPTIRKPYHDLITRRTPLTPPSRLLAFLDFYVALFTISVHDIFAQLVETNKDGGDAIASAKMHAQRFVQNHCHEAITWVPAACDREVADPWLAPAFLTMKPAGPDRYDPDRAQDRMDAASTAKALDSFADKCVPLLEDSIEKVAGDAYKKAAAERGKTCPSHATIDATIDKPQEPAPGDKRPEPEDQGEAARAKRQADLRWQVRNTEKAYYTSDEVEAMFGIAERTLRRWIDKGRKMGKLTLKLKRGKLGMITRESILRMLEAEEN